MHRNSETEENMRYRMSPQRSGGVAHCQACLEGKDETKLRKDFHCREDECRQMKENVTREANVGN